MCLGKLGSIVRTWDAGGMPMARVEGPGSDLDACLLYHPEAKVGDDVLVHLGFVIEVLDPAAAVDARRLRERLADPATGP
jgi:hydrogenase maturation factor